MTEGPGITGAGAASAAGARLRLARQARGFSQQQLAGMAGVSRQAVSAVEAGHTDPSLRVALALGRALGLAVEELFGPGQAAEPVSATAVAPLAEPGTRVALAAVGDRFVALPLRGDSAVGTGFAPASGVIAGPVSRDGASDDGASGGSPSGGRADGGRITVEPIGPPRPTLVVAGCDPALPLLATPLSLLDPPVSLAWWPCGSAESLRLASAGLVHAAGVHLRDADGGYNTSDLPAGAEVVGFTAWREGLAVRPSLAPRAGAPVVDGPVAGGSMAEAADAPAATGLEGIVRGGFRIVNREPGSEARRVLDRELERLGIDPGEVVGYDSRAAGHLQVASAIAAGIADAGVASEPAARAYGLGFVPLADERFDLVLPGPHRGAREVQALLKVLTSPWLLAELAGLPGYDPSACGERLR